MQFLLNKFCFFFRGPFFLAFLILLSSCESAKKSLNKNELEQFINNPKNGLIKQEEVNGFKIKIAFQPASLMAYRELNSRNKSDTTSRVSLKDKYKKYYHFFLSFSKNGKEAIRQLGSFQKYSEMLQVFAFRTNEFVNLTTPERDTVQLSDYSFEQSSGMSAGNLIMLVFSQDSLLKSDVIEVNIGECGLGTGNLKFIFDKRYIDKTPELDYKGVD